MHPADWYVERESLLTSGRIPNLYGPVLADCDNAAVDTHRHQLGSAQADVPSSFFLIPAMGNHNAKDRTTAPASIVQGSVMGIADCGGIP